MDFVVGTVARLAELKGHDDLLDALGEELRKRDNWKLLWVGDGWWRDRLLKRVAEMGLASKVVTTGLVPSERVPEMMKAMDVLVHPSYREGLPRTVPQALLVGVPVVAYDVDGTGEICINRVTGRLIPPKDTGALREAVASMYDHPDERAAMAARGRDLCRERFSAETMVAELEKVYAQALAMARA
jgi:glycosyltransferase involved in cell wall biosynthesis